MDAVRTETDTLLDVGLEHVGLGGLSQRRQGDVVRRRTVVFIIGQTVLGHRLLLVEFRLFCGLLGQIKTKCSQFGRGLSLDVKWSIVSVEVEMDGVFVKDVSL